MTARDPRTAPRDDDVIRCAHDRSMDVRVGTVLKVIATHGEPFDGLLVRYWTDGDYPDGESDGRDWWTVEEWVADTKDGEILERTDG